MCQAAKSFFWGGEGFRKDFGDGMVIVSVYVSLEGIRCPFAKMLDLSLVAALPIGC